MSVARTLLTQRSHVSTSYSHQQEEEDASLIIDAAVTLSTLAAKQAFTPSTGKSNTTASLRIIESFHIAHDLLQVSTLSAPSSLLTQTVDLLENTDLVLSVFERMDGSYSQVTSVNTDTTLLTPFKISEDSFTRDGILMASNKVLGPLMKFCLREIQRRNMHDTHTHQSESSHSDGIEATAVVVVPADLEELAGLLQRSENHMLTIRLLLTSWHIGSFKSQVLSYSYIHYTCIHTIHVYTYVILYAIIYTMSCYTGIKGLYHCIKPQDPHLPHHRHRPGCSLPGHASTRENGTLYLLLYYMCIFYHSLYYIPYCKPLRCMSSRPRCRRYRATSRD